MTTLKFLFCFGVTASALFAATDPFVGEWKWNAEKSPKPTITYAIKDLGGNRYALTGSTGDTVAITADGVLMDSPFGGTVSLKKLDDHRWEMVRNQQAKLVRTFTISSNDKSLQLHDVYTLPSGSEDKSTTTYARTSAGKGMLGEWRSVSIVEQPAKSGNEVYIKPFGKDGLTFAFPGDKHPFTVRLDGKTYSDKDQDPYAAKGSTTAATRINAHTISVVSQIDGKPDSTTEYKLSEDEKTVTIITKQAKSPAVFQNVLDRM